MTAKRAACERVPSVRAGSRPVKKYTGQPRGGWLGYAPDLWGGYLARHCSDHIHACRIDCRFGSTSGCATVDADEDRAHAASTRHGRTGSGADDRGAFADAADRLPGGASGGAERLWSGELRVGGYNSASFNSTVSEAPETCPADKSDLGNYAPNFSRTIRVSVSRRGYDGGNNGFFVSASWTRPGLPCEEYGSSTVSFDRPIKLEVGSKAEMKGDGGLVVRLTRLK
ncbi:hypothetical protein OKA06_07745 [Novosphingobium sp. MW5]|nr:hypothetical protein [Novosphingobium sp. MW5]